MKVMIASVGQNLDSPVSVAFGRAPYFIVANTDEEGFEVKENQSAGAPRGAGVAASQQAINQQAQAVVAGNFGPNAFNVLQAGGVKIFSVSSPMSVSQAISALKEGQLKEVVVPTAGFGRGGRGWQGGRGC
jgi:predicted Fe-Mo cluster-binding NifX family protein